MYIAIFGGTVLALFGYVYVSTIAFVRERSQQAVAVEFEEIRQAYARGARSGAIAAIDARVAGEALGRWVFVLADRSRSPIAGNAAWPRLLSPAEGSGQFDGKIVRSNAAPQRIEAHYTTFANGDRLLVGRDAEDVERFVRLIEAAFTAAVILMFTIAAVSSITITRRTVLRIESINATSRAIVRDGLGDRIPVCGTHDEWDKVAENLNSMFERMEELMQDLRQVTNNVAHDLRTPLTRMRGRLERATKQPVDEGAHESLVRDTLADLDNVLGLFSSLLLIASLEARESQTAFRTLDLVEIAGEVAELFDAAAEERGGGVVLAAEKPAIVLGNRDLLFDAFSNLLDNALKHGGDNARVEIEVTNDVNGPAVSVADRGPGIPIEERKLVLKRFYRLERSRSTPGNGLGLSLVAAVAQLHGAEVEMASNRPGLKIALRFPPHAQ